MSRGFTSSTYQLSSKLMQTGESIRQAPPKTEPKPAMSKILIANRGEIACRIIETCKTLSIPTVAIYSTIDAKSPHVQMADEAICVGPASSSDSYLNVDRVCKAIQDSGAEGVHPGYGFLSENSEFARRVSQMKTPCGKSVKFIGPPEHAIIDMGDKITSKKIAKEAGVNCIPGYDGFVHSSEEAISVANQIGFPVMIKATSGGGGKGMRICYNDEQVAEGFVLSTAEAKSFFNDERLFVEKFIERPHHIEIQLLAGRKAQAEDAEVENDLEILCFPERECSIQRRNQKILEESPSTLLLPETRAEMIRQVKSLVRKTNYESAGTVEFLVDEDQNFYFLEMNTRLQVEHPVTEMVAGNIDLVRGMIDVAAGKGIPTDYMKELNSIVDGRSHDIDGLAFPHTGHAIEARIYAEDSLRGFLPSIGPLLKYSEPPLTEDDDGIKLVRVDSGVTCGSMISQYYDPMISKLIAYSPNNRQEAIDTLRAALARYVICGVEHNIPFISDVLRNEDFVAGKTPTNFIDLHYPDGFSGVNLGHTETLELAATVAILSSWNKDVMELPPLPMERIDDDDEEVVVSFGGMFGDHFLVKVHNIDDNMLEVTALPKQGDSSASTTSLVSLEIDSYQHSDPLVTIKANGCEKVLQVYRENSTGLFKVNFQGAALDVLIMTPSEYELSCYMNEPKVVDTSNFILSPMPGTLMSFAVEEGDHVLEGQEICIVEAMKMQNVIRSPRAGTIAKLCVDVNSSLMADEAIIEFVETG